MVESKLKKSQQQEILDFIPAKWLTKIGKHNGEGSISFKRSTNDGVLKSSRGFKIDASLTNFRNGKEERIYEIGEKWKGLVQIAKERK